MKQNNTEVDSNQQNESKQKMRQKLLELFYNSNLSAYANNLKKCIPQLDCNYQNRFIRKNDKLYVETNLSKLFQKASDKLQKILLSKNQPIKITIDQYQTTFQSIPQQIIFSIQKNAIKKQFKHIRSKKKFNTIPCRNQSFSIQNVNSEPSCPSFDARKTLSSKRVFRVRQFKNNIQQMINNTRYTEKLQKVKLQSSFAEFFFQKDINPQESKTLNLQKMNIDKIKLMTNIRWNFNPPQKLQKIHRIPFQRESQNGSNYLGFEVRKQSYYKPKSKCQGRQNNKIFLNF